MKSDLLMLRRSTREQSCESQELQNITSIFMACKFKSSVSVVRFKLTTAADDVNSIYFLCTPNVTRTVNNTNNISSTCNITNVTSRIESTLQCVALGLTVDVSKLSLNFE